jgi:hypothetical protein
MTLLSASVFAACGGGLSTRASVCGVYDELGRQLVSSHPLSDNVIFRDARALADEASNYMESPAIQAEAEGIRRIGKSNSTTPAELLDATTAIAGLCGHPLGVGGTTDDKNSPPPSAAEAQQTEQRAADEVISVLQRYAEATRAKDYQTLCNDLLAESVLERIRSVGLPCEVALRTGLEDRKNLQLEVLGDVELHGNYAQGRVRSTAAGEATSVGTLRLVREGENWRIATSQPAS